jgi:site-specific DNA-methyltransferase (cytosine-N4-specific)
MEMTTPATTPADGELLNRCHQGDCRAVMRDLIAAGVRVQCIVTSPPYWGLRDYGHPGQIGQEPTLHEFLANMIEVFDLCRELLADDGVLWLNMGDSYANGGRKTRDSDNKLPERGMDFRPADPDGVKPKDLIGQPWRLAFSLQDAGWWLRQDNIWHKPNPMPESVTDRCTKAHEYIFMLTKNARYYFDSEAIKEPAVGQNEHDLTGPGYKAPGQAAQTGSRRNSFARETKATAGEHGQTPQHRADRADVRYEGLRNKRSVWTVPTKPYAGAHFAVMPEELVEPCILAGSRPGDIVFDPFMGSGTVASVAQRLGRRWLGAELNPDYIALQAERTRQIGLALESAS